jgi:membrane protein implicated in regulation of membrane protease activity
MADIHVVIIKPESMVASMISDTYTLAILIVPIALGVFLGSTPMQWIGFIVTSIALLYKLSAHKVKKYTIAEARAKLDELEGK